MLNISEVGIEYENSMVRGKYNKSDGMVTHLNTLAVLICFLLGISGDFNLQHNTRLKVYLCNGHLPVSMLDTH